MTNNGDEEQQKFQFSSVKWLWDSKFAQDVEVGKSHGPI
jgi:hypothetical protein